MLFHTLIPPRNSLLFLLLEYRIAETFEGENVREFRGYVPVRESFLREHRMRTQCTNPRNPYAKVSRYTVINHMV